MSYFSIVNILHIIYYDSGKLNGKTSINAYFKMLFKIKDYLYIL